MLHVVNCWEEGDELVMVGCITRAEAKAAAYDSYLSYAGRWRVDGDEVVHDVELALVPEVVGQEQRRRARMEGEELVLTYGVPARHGVARFELRWRRA